jgi:hypothetical protein
MSDVEGWIFDIKVHSGDLVKKGQSLLESDPRRQAATVPIGKRGAHRRWRAENWRRFSSNARGVFFASGVISKQDSTRRRQPLMPLTPR